MVRDVAAGRCTDTSGPAARDAAARALVAASCRSLGVLDLDRRSSVATPFLLGAPMKFKGERPLPDPSGRECLNAGQSAEASKQI
jgi:hypothetical protein